jgi:alpha-galactosidase
MSFGPSMVNDVVHTPALAGSLLMLHDIDPDRLRRAYQFAAKLNAAAGAPVRLDYSTDAAVALEGARYVMASAEHNRFEYWHQDYEIPNAFGATQITGENGGPGAVFHSLRSITNTLEICADIERYCPDALLINLTNPMSRVTLAINRATKVDNVGMCHEMPMGINRLCRRLRVKRADVTAKAAGINHFTFFTEFRNVRTGEDLLPRLRELFAGRFFDYGPRAQAVARNLDRTMPGAGLVEFNYMPLVAKIVRETGYVACSVDSHIGEYLPFALEAAEWMPAPIEFHGPVSHFAEKAAAWAARTKVPLPLQAMGHSPEEVVPIIAAMHTGDPRWIMAVNVPNRGYLPDVADGAIVEVGATVDGEGIHPDEMDPIGEPVAGWIATQVELQNLVVESALQRNPDLAFEALRNDPNSPADESACRAMFDELMTRQAAHLPF